jgi:two-component system sensor histidine kinase UhpB
LAEKTVQLERLATLVLAAQEEERRRIARELHDETMQSLAALIMGLEGGLQAMPEQRPHLRDGHLAVARLRDLAVRTLDELRHLALDLRPAVLDDHGLVAAVRWLARTQEERFGLTSVLELAGGFVDEDVTRPGRLPAAVETAVFRIVQEALANVAKHARAKRVAIRLARDAAGVSAEVEDDGVGLPAAHERPPGHMGLFNMCERAALLGGRCTIRAAGRGTIVRVVLPLPPSPAAHPVPWRGDE